MFGLNKNCYQYIYTDPVLRLDVLCELDLFWILPWQQQVQLALWAGDSWIEAFSFDHSQVDYSNSPDSLRILSLAWWYFFSKFVDLLDTFFFVARYTHDKVLLWMVWYLAFCEGRSTAMCRLCTWSTIAPFPGSPGGDQSEFLLWIRCHKSVFFFKAEWWYWCYEVSSHVHRFVGGSQAAFGPFLNSGSERQLRFISSHGCQESTLWCTSTTSAPHSVRGCNLTSGGKSISPPCRLLTTQQLAHK